MNAGDRIGTILDTCNIFVNLAILVLAVSFPGVALVAGMIQVGVNVAAKAVKEATAAKAATAAKVATAAKAAWAAKAVKAAWAAKVGAATTGAKTATTATAAGATAAQGVCCHRWSEDGDRRHRYRHHLRQGVCCHHRHRCRLL